jgi:hypothetical protein
MLNKFLISTLRRVSKKRKMVSKLIELSRDKESQQLLCPKKTLSYLLKHLRLMVIRLPLSRLLWYRKSSRPKVNRLLLALHQMSKMFN